MVAESDEASKTHGHSNMLDRHGTLRKEDKLKYYTCAGGRIQHNLNYHNFFNFRMCQQRGCDGKANATSNCCSFQMRGPHLSNPTSNHNCDLPAQASKFGRWTLYPALALHVWMLVALALHVDISAARFVATAALALHVWMLFTSSF